MTDCYVKELINNLHEHKPGTASEFILTNLVIRLAEVVREQQGRIEKLEKQNNAEPVEDHQVTEWQVYNPTDGNLLAKGTDKSKVLASLPLDTEYIIIKHRISY